MAADLLEPRLDQLSEEYVLVQAWKKTAAFIRYHRSGGLKLVPDYTFKTAPLLKIVVVPVQKGSTALHEWLRTVTQTTDVTMSVCTGAFQLAKGWLALGSLSHNASRLHRSSDQAVSDIDVKRGLRFVEGTKIATAGGLCFRIALAARCGELCTFQQIC